MNTPGGKPASWTISANSIALSGAISLGFRTTVQPADPQRPHGRAAAAPAGDARSAYATRMAKMHHDMERGLSSSNADVAFVQGLQRRGS